ncbi:mannosyl-oligosaccharide alpha-1,2-mannosidase [Agyrium rufum]|nr:mannosyl-oligosaccharide alpha-1,2-mannosidase [Agyrium rufum]
MSFALPRNVPSFESSQRTLENTYWTASGRTHQNGHTNGTTLGNTLGGIFEGKQAGAALPMYKDKPYSYGGSSGGQSRKSLLRPRRLWLSLILVLAGLAWFFEVGPFATVEDAAPSKTKVKGADEWWSSLRPGRRKGKDEKLWLERREEVKEAFIQSWDGYSQNAWGYDEYHPVSKQGSQMATSGLGWIIVDALDTLMIMNLTSRLSHAREWMSTTLNYDQDTEVNTFETTIRMLGGLLSAHYLSTTYPDMAPLTDDDFGTPGEDLYLEKAADLADRLLGAFDTNSGVPASSVNLKTLDGIVSKDDGGASSTAEAASLQLEFKYLAMLMGEATYWTKAEKVIQIIDDNGMEDGLLPIFIYADRGVFRGNNIRLGSRGDSYYEYLIKQYLQTSKQESLYLDMWNQALRGVRKHLITYSEDAHFTILAERPTGLDDEISPKMDHLVCFMPGTIALGATEGLPLAEARKLKTWGKQQEEDMDLARELTKTCWGMYKAMATGLAPEIAHFNIATPPHMYDDGKLESWEIEDWDGSAGGNMSWIHDFIIKHQDAHNLQRPETVESLFYMWRITGDSMYREWGWEMFQAFVKHTSVEGGAGFTSLNNANTIPPQVKDNMESFWLAETLKYFYLLFSPNDLLPLDKIVINTEAHIFPRFKLQKNLKTGWARKPRDEDGNMIPDAVDEQKVIKEQKARDEKKAAKETKKVDPKKSAIDKSGDVPKKNDPTLKAVTLAADEELATYPPDAKVKNVEVVATKGKGGNDDEEVVMRATEKGKKEAKSYSS